MPFQTRCRAFRATVNRSKWLTSSRIYRFRATSSDFEIKLRELWQKCRNVRELSAKYSAVNAVVDVRRILKRYYELEVVRYFTVSMIVSVRFVISRALYNFCALTLWLNIRTLQ
jgi:hypothetical protein